MTIHPTVLHHMIVSSRQLHADLLLSMEAEPLIDKLSCPEKPIVEAGSGTSLNLSGFVAA